MTTLRPGRPSLLADRSGASAVTTALGMIVTLGFIGVGVDLGAAYHARRGAQNAADSAAFSGASAVLGGGDVDAQARAIAASYGFAHGTSGVTVAVNDPPASGDYSGQAKAVEVVIERPGRRYFSGFFASGPTTIRARAVALAGTLGNACVIALDEKAEAETLTTGSADVDLVGCSLFSNSNSPTALELKGSARIAADSVGVVGGYAVGNNATLTTVNGVKTGQKPIKDPYADVNVPPHSGCDFTGGSLPAGTYGRSDGQPFVLCGGVTINSGATVRLNPGIYVIKNGDFLVNGGATLIGEGVTLVLTGETAASVAKLDFRGNANITLTAPTAGPTAGLAIFQDRKALDGENKINGGASQNIKGAIYFPSQNVVFTGGATSTSDCTQLLASRVTFRGNSRLGINCAGTGVRMAGGIPTTLVE